MQYLDAVLLLALGAAVVGAVYLVGHLGAVDRRPLVALPHTSGGRPTEHAWGRYHARWYLASMVFLAFDIEMLFMYPWAAVLPTMSLDAVVEMFGFLVIVMAGVVYAWREGAFRWS